MTATAEATEAAGRPPDTAVALVGHNGRATRQVVRITGLQDLEVIAGEIELVRPGDGAVLSVPYRSLTQDELIAERKKVKWPEPPKHMVPGAKGSRPVLVENREDPAFVAAQEDAAAEYSLRLITRCLVGGGLEVPGETEDEQLAAVRARLGSWASMALGQALSGLHGVSDEDVRVAAGNSRRAAASN